MDFELIAFISLLIIILLIYRKILSFIFRIKQNYIKWSINVTSLLFLCLLVFFAYEKKHYFEEYYDRILLPIITTLFIWLISNFTQKTDPSAAFRATYNENVNILGYSYPNFKKVSDIRNNQIPTYPRFTVFEGERKVKNKVIFDSSDFTVVNKTFGTFNKDYGAYFMNMGKFRINEKEYYVVELTVALNPGFEDYSEGFHTPCYLGEDTPYNIQINIYAEPI